jgi:hypothetical protein
MPDPATRIDVADVLAVDAALQRSTGADRFGVTREGFIPKPFARLLAERLALARSLMGTDVDLSSGSAIRKLLELSALEDARTWAALATIYDNSFVATATGEALSRLGEELGLPRPYLEAQGRVKLSFQGTLQPGETAPIPVWRGTRLLTPGGHHCATLETIEISPSTPPTEVGVVAFYPGFEHNLDPTVAAPDGSFPQKINRWHPAVDSIITNHVAIEHTQRFTGGELMWPDTRYRELVLRAPRSIWTVDAIRIAASLVPGVRQVQVRDAWGGLDINQSIFGNFNFLERLFGEERDLGTPYYFTLLVAKTDNAIWQGDDGLAASVASAIEDLRPIGIFPKIEEASEVGVGIQASLVVEGIPLPSGGGSVVNDSPAALALKMRLLQRLRRYVEALDFGQPVRWSEVVWALMNEPGVADLRDAKLLVFPTRFNSADLSKPATAAPTPYDCGKNVDLQVNEIAVVIDDPSHLTIV